MRRCRPGKATEHFARMVALLGGPADFVEKMDQHLAPAPIVRDVFAGTRASSAAIDTRGVGMAVVALGGGRRMPTDKIDHAVGFDQLAGLGTKIDAGNAAGAAACTRRGERGRCGAAPDRCLCAWRQRAQASAHSRADRPYGERVMPRAILCILDSFGIGGAPDAADYNDGHGHNDMGSDTLGHIADKYDLHAAQSGCARAGCGGQAVDWTRAARADRHAQGRALGRGPRSQQGQGHALGALGDRRRAGALRLGLFSADAARPFPTS